MALRRVPHDSSANEKQGWDRWPDDPQGRVAYVRPIISIRPVFRGNLLPIRQFFLPPTLNNTGTDFVNGSKSSMVEREIEQLHVIRLLRVKRRLFSRVKYE